MKVNAGTLVSILALAGALAGCARTGTLYPVHLAGPNSPNVALKATFIASGTGHGKITLPMPDGEILSGEFSLIRGGEFRSDSIYASVWGPGGYANASGSGSGFSIPSAARGVASVIGNKGTRMDCEFTNDNFSGHGYGACKSSTGDTYKMLY